MDQPNCDSSALIAKLTDALKSGATPSDRNPWRPPSLPSPLLTLFIEELSLQVGGRKIDDSWHVSTSHPWICLDAREIADVVLREAVLSSPTHAVEQLLAELTVTTWKVRYVSVVEGVIAQSPFRAAGFEICDTGDLAESPWKRRVYIPGPRREGSRFLPGAHTALIQSFELAPAEADADNATTFDQSPFRSLQKRAFDAAPIMALLGGTPVFVRHEWIEIGTPLLCQVYSHFGISSFLQPTSPLPRPPSVLSADELRRILRAYFDLGEPDQRRMRIALKRLNLARNGLTPEDMAIDIAIGFEVLLSIPAERRNKRHLIVQEVSRLAGPDQGLAREAKEVAELVYQARNLAVHTGELDRTIHGFPAMQRGANLLKTLIVQAITKEECR